MGGGGGPGGDFALVLQELIPPGSMVKKGDIVAEFDRQYMLTRLDDYKDSVVQNEANQRSRLAQLDVTRKARLQNIESARGDVERARLDLKTLPVRSAIESERFRLALEEAEARYRQVADEMKLVDISERATLRISEIELQQSKIELQRAEANINRMIIRAPIEGLTVMQQTFRGAEFGTIQQGDQVSSGQPFMRIVDLRSMVIEASVNQADVEMLRIGQKARVRFDAYPDLELPAHVFSIGAMTKTGGFRGSFIKEIPVRLRLDKLDPRVIPDLTVSADVILESSPDEHAMVPLQAVFRDSGDAQPYVFVRTPSGWQTREVKLGLANYVTTAVTSGLNRGEVIALQRPPAPGAGAGQLPGTNGRKE